MPSDTVLKRGQWLAILRGGLEGGMVILLKVALGTEQLIPRNQIWNCYLVKSPDYLWKVGETLNIRACDLMKW